MLFSSRDALLKLSITRSPQKNCSHLIASHCSVKVLKKGCFFVNYIQNICIKKCSKQLFRRLIQVFKVKHTNFDNLKFLEISTNYKNLQQKS